LFESISDGQKSAFYVFLLVFDRKHGYAAWNVGGDGTDDAQIKIQFPFSQ
jgi:hypothetical protein